jgi:FtsH-binding integral membrane protein
MWKSVARWTAGLLAFFLLGPIAAWLTGSLRGPTGGLDATLFLSRSFPAGVTAAAGVAILVILGGLSAARLVGLKSGMLVAGLIAAWAAWRLGTLDDIIRVHRAPGMLYTLAIEGLLISLVGVLTAILIEASAPPPIAENATPARGPQPILMTRVIALARETLTSKASLAGAVAGAVTAGFLVYVIAFEPTKGQGIFAAFVGAIGAGVAAHLTAQSVGGRATLATPILSIALLALVGPIIANFTTGSRILTLMYEGRFHALAVPLSLDWLAGALMGTPIGLGWAGVMLERHEQPKAA